MDDMRQVHEDRIRQFEGTLKATAVPEAPSAPDSSPESRRSPIPIMRDSAGQDKREKDPAEEAWKQEKDDLEAIMEKIEQENADLRTRLRELEQQLEPVTSNAPEEPEPVDVYASMDYLLSPLAQGGQHRSRLEREVKQLRYMLEESEEQVAALRTQEKILKEEIRKLDSFDRRQNLSNEYLKNVLLKFMETENKEVSWDSLDIMYNIMDRHEY
ncbi:hypothetical protein BCR43DRAFT_21026 [Syncephalastrum racemosum]|uniref:GRIP domain-containing protein n=1 Tax=Syncephalastrum racemosum TaxID=13706 RepID=A0A1X2HT46_SYNRA|nr:hypothetical protein BCR43DRAFT_21026 [Syncephalastrum racemosum]